MSDRNASNTALGTLFMRGVHQLLDAKPLILDDPVALTLLGEDTCRQWHRAIGDVLKFLSYYFRGEVVVRSHPSSIR